MVVEILVAGIMFQISEVYSVPHLIGIARGTTIN